MRRDHAVPRSEMARGGTGCYRLCQQETPGCSSALVGQDLSYPPPVAEQQQGRKPQGDLIHRPWDWQQAEDQQPPDRAR
jgi:hypothetical protein